jgi:hypothetical protein
MMKEKLLTLHIRYASDDTLASGYDSRSLQVINSSWFKPLAAGHQRNNMVRILFNHPEIESAEVKESGDLKLNKCKRTELNVLAPSQPRNSNKAVIKGGKPPYQVMRKVQLSAPFTRLGE